MLTLPERVDVDRVYLVAGKGRERERGKETEREGISMKRRIFHCDFKGRHVSNPIPFSPFND